MNIDLLPGNYEEWNDARLARVIAGLKRHIDRHQEQLAELMAEQLRRDPPNQVVHIPFLVPEPDDAA